MITIQEHIKKISILKTENEIKEYLEENISFSKDYSPLAKKEIIRYSNLMIKKIIGNKQQKKKQEIINQTNFLN